MSILHSADCVKFIAAKISVLSPIWSLLTGNLRPKFSGYIAQWSQYFLSSEDASRADGRTCSVYVSWQCRGGRQ